MRRILVVDDEENLRVVLRTLLRRADYEVETASTGEEALSKFETFSPDFVLTDVRMPTMTGLELLKALREKTPTITVLVMSAYGSIDLALEAIKAGAYDYIAKPFKPDEVLLTLRKAEEREALRRENQKLREAIHPEHNFAGILAKSSIMIDLFRTIKKIADYKTTVLIIGESGVGKELIARAIHTNSSRAKGPFIAVNCGAIPENLLESELFGHKKGAFTDAHADRKGLFEEAHNGSLFLDEIGELPLALQVKLLRALQEETIRRLGETRDIAIDTRIIAATHRDLFAEVKAGRFREDLLYRLNVLPLNIPPLRERQEDIPLLIESFIARNNLRLGLSVQGIDVETRKVLLEYSWPGNVRELENTIERAMILAEQNTLHIHDLPERIRNSRDVIQRHLASDELSIKKVTRIIEETLIRRALQKTKGNRTRAAELLELSHRALLYKIKEYKLEE